MRRTAAAAVPGAYKNIFTDLKAIAAAFYSNLKKIFVDRGERPKKLNEMCCDCPMEGFKDGVSCQYQTTCKSHNPTL